MNLKKTVEQALEDHKQWLETNGAVGEQFDLSGQFLQGSNLSGADLTGTNFIDATIVDAQWSRKSLIKAHLFPATDSVKGVTYRTQWTNPATRPNSGSKYSR